MQDTGADTFCGALDGAVFAHVLSEAMGKRLRLNQATPSSPCRYVPMNSGVLVRVSTIR